MKDVLIIPDVHGRTFWKPAMQKYAERLTSGDMDCVFLGDYLDPYEFEIEIGLCGGYNAAIRNFSEIITLKEAFGSNIHLLLGNHDLHYIDEYQSGGYKCRCMYDFYPRIEKMLRDNWKKFSVAYECRLDSGRRCLMTHAGVMKAWVDSRFDNMAEEDDITADWLNSFLLPPLDRIYMLDDFGWVRGGYGYGSPVWADASEFYGGFQNEKHRKELDKNVPQTVYTGIFQIFGHSLFYPYEDISLLDRYYICDDYAMLDSRRAFVLHADGSIEEA